MIGIAVVIGVGILYYLWYLGGKTEAYDDIPDLSSEYNVDDRIAEAQEALNTDIEPATVYTNDPNKNVLSITFDGLPDPTTTAKLIDLIDKYDMKVTFFVEGGNCAEDKESVEKLSNKDIELGNYTYAGVTHLEKMPTDSALEQLLKTQKVLEVLTGDSPTLFKAPNTSYVVPLLKLAAAAGLKSAVKTDIFVNKDDIKTDEDAMRFINSVPQGSIISLNISTPVNTIVYEAGKTDEKPAVDKQPNLKIRELPITEHQNIVDVTERLFKAIKMRNITTVPISQMRKIKRADILPTQQEVKQQAQGQSKQIGNITFLNTVGRQIDKLLFNKAMAATPNNGYYDELRLKNKHHLAQNDKMIYTSEPSVAFAFAGLTKPQVVYKALDYLKKNNIHGTFFVMDNEIRANPEMVQAIVHSGNEVAIGIRSLKDADYYSVCRQLDDVKTRLAKLGVKTNLVMQPWGQITDDTREAVSAMGYKLISPTLNIVSSKHKQYTSADAVMNEQFGKYVYSVGRGWIVYFRLDFYDDDNLVINVLDLVKRHKVDNIAYNSFYDDPKINSSNDSAYAVKSVGSILQNKAELYNINPNKTYSEDGKTYLKPQNITFNNFIAERYIGNEAVVDDNIFGFTVEEKLYRDITGTIHTDKPVVFFTFDDFGSDAAINHLLYVFRKHHAKATFFVLTNNVMKNPNIIRAIAKEGHDVASHSEVHRPMDGTNFDEAYSNYLVDYGIALEKLSDIAGDVTDDKGTSVVRPYFRPPTLTISRAGFKALYDTGYQYIVSGSYSTHDYEQPNLQSMVAAIKNGVYAKNGKVQKGAVLVMHMSDQSIYTAVALDMLMTINDKRSDDDPEKFIALPLSAYLSHNYSQINSDKRSNNADIKGSNVTDDSALYQNVGY